MANAGFIAVISANTWLLQTTLEIDFVAYLASFISICWRISWRSWSLLAGKMFLSSSSCLLGLFRSLTASNSFLNLRGSVPATMHTRVNEQQIHNLLLSIKNSNYRKIMLCMNKAFLSLIILFDKVPHQVIYTLDRYSFLLPLSFLLSSLAPNVKTGNLSTVSTV